MSFGPIEIAVVLFVIAMIVGPSRIARMARSLGRGAYEFVDEIGGDKKGKDKSLPEELEAGDTRDTHDGRSDRGDRGDRGGHTDERRG